MPDAPRAHDGIGKTVLLLAVVALVYGAVRAAWSHHLLMWDEAMNLCAVRAFASGGYDWYSYWIWRYPPMLSALLLLARPLQDGYVLRAYWIPLLVGLATVPVLFALNRRIFGLRTAAWSCLLWAVLPASVFFGLWIKQDGLVILFGLLALDLFARRRVAWSGLALGFAFLAKEMAVFYAVALAILALSERRYRDLVVVAVVCALTAGWWFGFFSASVKYFFAFAAGHSDAGAEIWKKPALYYFARLPDELGVTGLLVAALGAAVLLAQSAMTNGTGARRDRTALWPFALLVPSLVILTLARGKTPWYSMTLLPAWATLGALGIEGATLWLARRGVRCWLRFAAGLVIVILLTTPMWGRSYEQAMENTEPRMWWASSASREAAETLNRVVQADQQVLITPMHYYGPDYPVPCPIFVAYLKPFPVVVRSNRINADQVVAEVRAQHLSWAMVSPPPGVGERELIWPLMQHYGLRPLWLKGACVFRTQDLWNREGS